jgi:N-formylmaleamate deformylase
VVLLHGLGEGALSWLRVALDLQADYDVIIPDARGHGLSERAADGWQDRLPEDAAAVIREVAGGPAHVVGFSLGGGTALHVADQWPELVRAVVVAGWADETAQPAPPGEMTQSEGYVTWYRSYMAWLEGLKSQSHAERMQASLSQLHPGAPLPEEIEYVTWVENAARLDVGMMADGARMWAAVPEAGRRMTEALGRVTRPTLLIKSGMWPTPGASMHVEEGTSERATVRVVRFVNAGHLVYREHHAPFVRLVREFLAAH